MTRDSPYLYRSRGMVAAAALGAGLHVYTTYTRYLLFNRNEFVPPFRITTTITLWKHRHTFTSRLWGYGNTRGMRLRSTPHLAEIDLTFGPETSRPIANDLPAKVDGRAVGGLIPPNSMSYWAHRYALLAPVLLSLGMFPWPPDSDITDPS